MKKILIIALLFLSFVGSAEATLEYDWNCNDKAVAPSVGVNNAVTTTNETVNSRDCQLANADGEVIQVPYTYFTANTQVVDMSARCDFTWTNPTFKFLFGRFTTVSGAPGDIYFAHYNLGFRIVIFTDTSVVTVTEYKTAALQAICNDGLFHDFKIAISSTDVVDGGSSYVALWLDGVLQTIDSGDITATWTRLPQTTADFGFAGNGALLAGFELPLNGYVDDITVNSYTGAIPTGPEITIKPYLDSQSVSVPRHVRQRDSAEQGSITVPITNTIGDGAIEARIMAGASVVKDWHTVLATPVSTTSNILITGIDQGGGFPDWYTVEMRYVDTPAVSATSTWDFGIGAVFGVMGQSLAKAFTDETTLVTNDTRAYFLRRTASGANLLFDSNGMDLGWQQLNQGNNGMAFASELISTLSIPIALIDATVSGTSVANVTSAVWADYLVAVSEVGDGNLEGMFIANGETEATDESTTALYSNSMAALLSLIRANIKHTDGATALPIYLSPLGRGYNVTWDTDVWQDHRTVQYDLIADNSDITFSHSDITWALEATYKIHPTGTYQVLIGENFAQTVLYSMGEVAYSALGPTVISWEAISSTQTRFYLNHDFGTDFTPTSAIVGFDVKDNGTIITPSGTVRESATTIVQTHVAVTGTRTASYMYGKDATDSQENSVINAVRDNTALLLPLKSVGSISEYVGPVPVIEITSPTTNPTYATNLSAIDLSGTSSISGGSIVSVGIVNDRGGSYTATGTTTWSESDITLYEGVNVITVTATSDLSVLGTDTITVTYTPPVATLTVDGGSFTYKTVIYPDGTTIPLDAGANTITITGGGGGGGFGAGRWGN